MILVSVLCPSRGRRMVLEASIAKLRAMAHRPDLVEVLVAADPDDPETAEADLGSPSKVWIAPERYGYHRLHEYYNVLASMASGTWLFLWNDDAVMLTGNWDERLAAEPVDGVLWPASNDYGICNVFPIWPRSWYGVTGHVSLNAHCDTWVQETGEALGRQRPTGIEIFHDTARLGGGNYDQVFVEGQAGHRSDDFYSEPMRASRQADAAKLRKVL